MAISEKAKEKLDTAGKEIMTAVDNLKNEVVELSKKVKERLDGAGNDMKETAEKLTKEVKALSEKVKELIPQRSKRQKPSESSKEILPVSPQAMRGYSFFEIQRDLNRIFDEFYRKIEMPSQRWGLSASRGLDLFQHHWPMVDISETGDEIQITAELPGVNKEELELSLSGDQLSIRGEKKKQQEKSGQDFYHLERYYGSFHRNIPLPCEVESDKVDASFRDGILTVVLKKTKAAQERSKRIKVQ
jgi:HSP20 family protein